MSKEKINESILSIKEKILNAIDFIKIKINNITERLKSHFDYFIKSKLYIKTISIIILITLSVNLTYNSFYVIKVRDIKLDIDEELITSIDFIYDYSISMCRKRIPNYSLSEIFKLDLTKPSGVTEADLKKITKKGIKGLEADFIEAEEKYGVNCVFLMSIAIIESGWGTILFKPNNMFGFGQKGYSSKRENIMAVAKSLSKNYLKKGGSCYNGETVSAVNKRYAASSKWDDKVASTMRSLYSQMYKNNQKELDKAEKSRNKNNKGN